MRLRYAPLLLSLLTVPSVAQTVPAPWASTDVGAPAADGEGAFSDDVFTVVGGGDLWGRADAFHLVSRPLAVDGVLTARVADLTDEPDWAKAALVMRASADPGAPYVGVVLSNLGVHFQVRSEADADTEGPTDVFGPSAPTWLRLRRDGASVEALYSEDGEAWVALDTAEVDALSGPLTVGLAVSAADFGSGTTVTAAFADVTLTDLVGNPLPVATEAAPAAGFTVEAVAPNPASGRATARVRADRPGPLSVEVFDLLGRRLAARRVSLSAGVSDVHLPIEAARPGSYVVRLTFEASGTAAVQRLVVLR